MKIHFPPCVKENNAQNKQKYCPKGPKNLDKNVCDSANPMIRQLPIVASSVCYSAKRSI